MHARASIFLLILLACETPAELPPEPRDAVAPRIATILPDVAIASLGSPLMVRGEHLAGTTDLFVGPLHFSGDSLKVSDGEVVVHVTADALAAAGLADADGEPQPVRVVTAGGSDTALETVRIYAELATIRELAPVDVAPRQLVYLRGNGFDGEDLENNVVALSQSGADCTGPQWTGPGDDCVHAKVFWAARGLVIAEVPEKTPSGPVKVIYRNRRFERLETAAEAWSAAGNDMAGFYQNAGGAPALTGNPQADAAAMGGYATTTVQEADVPEKAVVWLDPGVLTVTVGPQNVRIRGEGRLCYPVGDKGVPSERLRVLLDGDPVSRGILECTEDPNVLVFSRPAGLTGQHALQVANPFFQSPVAFFTPGG